MSWPSNMIEPAVGSSSLMIARPVVDLPHPDSPTRPSVSPASTEKQTPSTACTAPTLPLRSRCPWRIGKCFLRSLTASRIGDGGRGRSAVRFGFVRAETCHRVVAPELEGRRDLGRRSRWRCLDRYGSARGGRCCRASSGCTSCTPPGPGRGSGSAGGTRSRAAPGSATAACPGSGSSRACSVAVHARHRAEQAPGVGHLGVGEDVVDRALSTHCPPYMTTTVSHVSATTPRSWVMRMIAELNSRCRSFISSRICAWTVTSSAVVGSSAISSFGLQTSAIAIIARWRMPPENWCG